MLKVYNVYNYLSIDGADWRAVGGCGYKATDEDVKSKLILDNVSFDEAREYMSQHMLDGVWNDSTLFRHKPTIIVRYRDAWDWVVYRRFHTISYKIEFREVENVTFEWMAKYLSADQLIQYLKERGISACPMNF